MNVQSALGQPLKAEIEILDINAEEAATLSAKVAAPEAFKTAGLDYNAAMTGLQATLLRRPNGRAYLKLSSERAINEPFVDMILEASWSTGRIVRDYTMLFDPPGANAAAAVTITPAQAPQPARTAPSAVQATAEAKPALVPAPAPAKTAKPAPMPKAPVAQKVADTDAQRIVVKPGETAGRIAAVNKPANVSLDQMLVALLRTNPDAFIGDNVNRIKAGALVTLPTEAQATSSSPTQASQIIIAQSNDFNEFRRKLAGSAPTTQVAPSSREVSGKLQASVEDKKPSATTPDKLTLSKGAVTGKSTEDQLAQAKNAKATADRAAELAKNLQDLSKIAAASSAVAPVAANAKPAATMPQASTPAPAVVPAQVAVPVAPVVMPPVTVASVAAPASSAAATPASASVAASAPAKPASKAAPAPVAAEPSLIDGLLEEPLVPAGAIGLIALLAGFGFYKARQRKKAGLQDSSFGESRLQAESFFGSSGGQEVDTNDAASTGSSMIYSPSQLDAVDDVDPVAEADVYLAYGRDLQAEEILKDALRTRPERLAIHQKLLEIYAKRRDAKAFESIATLAFNLTNGIGQEWEQMCDMGLALDPDNALYLPGGQPFSDLGAPSRPAALGSAPHITQAYQATTPTDLDFATPGNSELDLDLDFSLDEPDLPDEPALSVATALPEAPALPDVPESEASEMDFGTLDSVMPPAAASDTGWTAPEQPTEPAWLDESSASAPEATVPMPLALEMEEDDPFGKTQVLSAATKLDKPANDSGMMEFDLGSLSLDFAMTKPGELSEAADAASPLKLEPLEEPETQAGAFMDATDDPLETKLALADEFKAIGDDDGARALIEEVIAEASGEMKAKAQRALKQL